MSKVLVLTNSYDTAHVNAIESQLRLRGHHLVRVDIDTILRGLSTITWDYQADQLIVESNDQRSNLFDVDSVWYRKPFGFGAGVGFAESIQDPVQRAMVEKEVRDIVDGLSGVLGSKPWANHPRYISQARLKPYQLQLARSIGFKVPDSIITSDPDRARDFCATGPTVFKALANQELDYGDVVCSIDTTLITEAHVRQLIFIKSQPILLQRCIDKSAELRVTCIRDQLFVARQTLKSDATEVDWRTYQDTDVSRYERWHVSDEVAAQIHSLMKALNLKFAAMDFAVDHTGEVWFLEANPNGQWLGYTDEVGMPAASAFAELLVP